VSNSTGNHEKTTARPTIRATRSRTHYAGSRTNHRFLRCFDLPRRRLGCSCSTRYRAMQVSFSPPSPETEEITATPATARVQQSTQTNVSRLDDCFYPQIQFHHCQKWNDDFTPNHENSFGKLVYTARHACH
jgi:hypothetical protein